MVKSQAKTVELTLMVRSPKTQVRPSRGSNTTDAMKMALTIKTFIGSESCEGVSLFKYGRSRIGYARS